MELIQNEMHYVNEKLTIDIDIKPIENGFIINYDNGRVKDEKFSISLDTDLLITLFKEFEKKSSEFIVKEELIINAVRFDFFRVNTLYFNVYFQNKVSKERFEARLYVFYKTNNHGNIGEVYAFELVNSVP